MNGTQPSPQPAPLARLTSIKTKLGVLVVASVVVAAVVATAGSDAGVAPWLALPITVALALAVTQLLAIGMTSPLREMTAAAARMARGDYDVRVRVRADSADEVGQLARTFNQMAADLGEVDQRRRDLVSTVSHELRTPLAGLVAVLENIEDGVIPADGVGTALRQAERLSDLVRDLLDLSRLEAGAVTLQPRAVVVDELLRAAVAEAEALGRPVRWDLETTPVDLVATVDPARLHQLVANLLDNASRHCPPGGTVQVRATGHGSTWALEVANPGDPIPVEDRERIFSRFGSLHDPGGGGTGLGLAIARWVCDLHGGSIAAVDPGPSQDQGGARLRAVLPTTTQETPVTPPPAPTLPPGPVPGAPYVPTVPPSAPGGSVLPPSGRLSWATDAVPPRPGLLLGALGVGVLAALLLVDLAPGLGYGVVLLAGGGVVWSASPHRREPFTLACAVLAAAGVAVLVLRDAVWIGVLCTLASTVLAVVGSTRARTLLGVLLSGLMWPLSAVHGMPWLGRTVRAVSGTGRAVAVVRTAVVSAVALLVFALLFSSADAVFADWLDLVTPRLRVDEAVGRSFVGLAVGGLTLATSYLALNPPQVEHDTEAPRRPTQHRWEWLAPVLVVDAVVVLFLVSQAAAIFGGDSYVEQTTGLTYADYVHQGFGQLTVATALTVLVVSVAARKAALATPADRVWLRGSLGLLGVLTLLVVASALHRLDLYVDAYGLTRFRLLAGVLEGWLGLVVVGLLVAGLRLRGGWLVRAGLLSGAGTLLVLALANPDAVVARHNVDRYAETGRVDLDYLRGLSADAADEIGALPPELRGCALGAVAQDVEEASSPWEWNLGRWQQRDLADDLVGLPTSCPDGGEVLRP